MAEYKIAVIPGDGVGLEVIDEGRKALEDSVLDVVTVGTLAEAGEAIVRVIGGTSA